MSWLSQCSRYICCSHLQWPWQGTEGEALWKLNTFTYLAWRLPFCTATFCIGLSKCRCILQGCNLGLERLGLETIFGTSRSRRGLEDITSQSRAFVTLGLVNIHAMHQACGYIRKKIMNLTHKKQVVKWQTSPISVSKLRHCGLQTFFWNVSVSSRSSRLNVSSRFWEFGKMERLGLVSVL